MSDEARGVLLRFERQLILFCEKRMRTIEIAPIDCWISSRNFRGGSPICPLIGSGLIAL